MTSCPSCQQPVEISNQHMGTLFTCPHCNAVYFIDWNGQPEIAQHEQEEITDESVPESIQDISFENNAPETENFQSGTDFQSGDNFQQGTSFEYQTEQEPVAEQSYQAADQTPVVQETVYGQMPTEAVEAADEIDSYDFDKSLDVALTPQPMSSMSSDTPDFSEVTDFANADTVSGPLAYSVMIEGIESSLLLNQLREAMTDSRFAWDVNDLLSQVRGGRLLIRNLGPAKASVLISRIKYLPFKISWRQDVLSGS